MLIFIGDNFQTVESGRYRTHIQDNLQTDIVINSYTRDRLQFYLNFPVA
jgi:hypothetical protein